MINGFFCYWDCIHQYFHKHYLYSIKVLGLLHFDVCWWMIDILLYLDLECVNIFDQYQVADLLNLVTHLFFLSRASNSSYSEWIIRNLRPTFIMFFYVLSWNITKADFPLCFFMFYPEASPKLIFFKKTFYLFFLILQ